VQQERRLHCAPLASLKTKLRAVSFVRKQMLDAGNPAQCRQKPHRRIGCYPRAHLHSLPVVW
jgi:hypothetical protein